MTNDEKIAVLKSNIANAERRAAIDLANGNDFGWRSNNDFADECRIELRRIGVL